MTANTFPTLTYTTVQKVFEQLNYRNEIYSEATGTGNGTTTVFQLGTASNPNRKVVQYSEVIYDNGTALTRDTDYTIAYDTGVVTFTVAPASNHAITADYWYSDLESTVIARYITHVEDEIDRNIGRTFKSNQTANEYLDGFASDDTSFYSYQSESALSYAQRYKTIDNNYRVDKTFFTSYYPIINVYGVSTNVSVDAQYSEANQNAQSNWGGANWIAQSFVAGGSNAIVKARVYLKAFTGTMAAITASIYADSGGQPTGNALATGTLAAFTDTTFAWRDVDFSVPYAATAGTTYHLVLSSPSSGTSAYRWGIDSTSPTYTSGALNTSANSGSTWTTDTAKDAIFQILTGTVINASQYVVYKDVGVISFLSGAQQLNASNVASASTGLRNTRGLQNIYVAYSYGYSSVPLTVEQLATKQTCIYLMNSRIFGDPSSDLNTRTQNIATLRQDVERLYETLGRKLQMYLV